MNKINLLSWKFFLWGLPLVFLLRVFVPQNYQRIESAGYYIRFLYDLVDLLLLIWMLLSIYVGICLMLSEAFREKTLTKLTFIKERDEREVMLTGRAAKTTLLTSIAILLFLFCLSCFQVSIYRLPPDQVVNGKAHMLAVSCCTFELWKDSPPPIPPEFMQMNRIFDCNGLPVSKSAVIIGLLAWQIIAYNYSMRKFMK